MSATKLKAAEKQSVRDLRDFAAELQSNGFKVIISEKYPFQWLYFEKNGKLGTVQPNYFSGFDFATVRKPSHEHGTGSIIEQMAELSVTRAEDCLLSGGGGEQYKDAQQFIDKNPWAQYSILGEEVQA